MSISDYIEQKAQAKKREVKYEIWKAKIMTAEWELKEQSLVL